MTWRPGADGEGSECLNARWLREKAMFVRCGQCSHCRVLRGKDWAGRAIAESKLAGRTLFVTLTVGGDRLYGAGVTDNVRAREFHMDDVRAYVKRMRKYVQPGRMRMFWVGENGDRKGRCHYHAMLYFYGTDGPQDLVLDKRYFHGRMEPGIVETAPGIPHVDGKFTWWPWGYTFFRDFQPKHAYYLASYVTKVFRDPTGEAERVFYTRPGVSTKPLLGALWFRWYALQHVQQGLSPQSRTYSFEREDGYEGGLAEYYMGEATWRLFVREFVNGWRAAHGVSPWPRSDVVDEHLVLMADQAAARRPYDWDDFYERHGKVVREKADLREKQILVQRARDAVADTDALLKAGITPVVKRDGVDDALNAALAIRDRSEPVSIGNGVVYAERDGPSIAEQEAEWSRRFGSFEDHERRWQAEVLRYRR